MKLTDVSDVSAKVVATAAVVAVSKICYDLYNDSRIRATHYAAPLAEMPNNAASIERDMKQVVDDAVKIIRSACANDNMVLSSDNARALRDAGITPADWETIQTSVGESRGAEDFERQLTDLVDRLKNSKYDAVDRTLAEGAVLQRNHEMDATREKISGVGLMLSSFMKEKGLSVAQIEEKTIARLSGPENPNPTVQQISHAMIQSASRVNQNLVGRLMQTMRGQGHAQPASRSEQQAVPSSPRRRGR